MRAEPSNATKTDTIVPKIVRLYTTPAAFKQTPTCSKLLLRKTATAQAAEEPTKA